MSKRPPLIHGQIDVGALLEAFVRSRHYVPPGARRIRSQEGLPLSLQCHIDSMAWRAWEDGSRIWFVKAEPVSDEQAAGLQVIFFDMDGRVVGSGSWMWYADRGWVLSNPAAAL
jgi:hypothetical protein